MEDRDETGGEESKQKALTKSRWVVKGPWTTTVTEKMERSQMWELFEESVPMKKLRPEQPRKPTPAGPHWSPTSCLCAIGPVTQTLRGSISFSANGDRRSSCLWESVHRLKEIMRVNAWHRPGESSINGSCCFHSSSNSKVPAHAPQCPPFLGKKPFFFF